jgi:hypothetical protein
VGKILFGGDFGVLKRLNSNGTADTNFTPPKISGRVFSVAVQADGKVFIGGAFGGGIKRLNAALPQSTTSGAVLGGGSSNTMWIILIAVVGAAVVPSGITAVRRRRARTL